MKSIEGIPSLERVIYFPDLTYKEKTEAPASIAAATRGTIIPTLTAPSLGCSMGLIKTSLTKEVANERFERELFSHLQDEVGQRYGFFFNLLRLVGLAHREKKKYDLDYAELEAVVRSGPYDLRNVSLRGIIPLPAWIYGGHDIGYGFKGNHFVEVQYVEEILDPVHARAWGVTRDQVVIMYHGGGGTVPYYIGRFFGNRRKNTTRQRLIVGVGKLFFHLLSRDALKRLRYYFYPRPHEAVPRDSREGERFMTAIKAAENYATHWNSTMCRRITDALRKTTAGQNVNAALLVAQLHNTIRDEDGFIVHRHTANRVEEGRPTTLSGSRTAPSYLAVGLAGTRGYLSSADHGGGDDIERVVSTLTEWGVIRAVARLRPLYTFKQ